MRELGSSEWREIEAFARVPRDCQEAGLARIVRREECAEGWAAGVMAGGKSVLAGRRELAGVKYLAELNAAEVEGASETEDVLRGVFGWWKLAGDGSTPEAP